MKTIVDFNVSHNINGKIKMKTKIVCYSMTGNNEKLAKGLEKKLSARLLELSEKKKRTPITIGLDFLLKRKPKVIFDTNEIKGDDLIIFLAPTWFGRIAFPMHTCMDEVKDKVDKYAYISLSAGGEGPDSNPNLETEVEELMSKKPVLFMNLHIADLIESDGKPTQDEIFGYELTDSDVEMLVEKIILKL